MPPPSWASTRTGKDLGLSPDTQAASRRSTPALANAIGMYQSGEHKLSEITAATGISRSTLYRNLPKGGDGDG